MRERIIKLLQLKRYNWRNYDFFLVVVVLLLSVISSYVLSLIATEPGEFSLKRQVVSIVASLVIIAVVSIIDYHDLCAYMPIIYIVATILAAATILSPLKYDYDTGSFRWLDLGVIKFQPSEVCKIVVVMSLAVFLHKIQTKGYLKTFRAFFLACAIALLPTGFILMQSDLSSSVVIMVVLIMMLFSSGMGRKVLGPVVAVVAPTIAVLFWYIQQPNQKLLHGYQLDRIIGWLHPEDQDLEIMYQQNRSVSAIASGKLYGKMLEGTEGSRNYNSVGVIESDFIWTPISEEFGFVGCLVILALLSIVIIKSFIIAKKAKDYIGMMIAIGIGSMFCFQTFFNIGVTTSLLPNTGLPLPFLSSGLTSLLSNMMAIGILINIGIQPNRGSSSFDFE